MPLCLLPLGWVTNLFGPQFHHVWKWKLAYSLPPGGVGQGTVMEVLESTFNPWKLHTEIRHWDSLERLKVPEKDNGMCRCCSKVERIEQIISWNALNGFILTSKHILRAKPYINKCSPPLLLKLGCAYTSGILLECNRSEEGRGPGILHF